MHQIPSKYETERERTIKSIQNLLNPLGFSTGLAANISYETIDNILNESSKQKTQSNLYGYTNPLTGSNHIYTREEVGSMTSDNLPNTKKK